MLKLFKRLGLIRCKHKWLPVFYGLLNDSYILEDNNVRKATSKERGYFKGGCVIPSKPIKFICLLCGKEVR